MKHTPGPLFVKNDKPIRIDIVDVNNEVIFSEYRYSYSSTDETGEDAMFGKGLGLLSLLEKQAAIAANERQLADIHLRAAAPELLDELESLVRRLKAHYPGFETTSARSAIAKAKGEI